MSSYHGWDREELQVAGLESSEGAGHTFPAQSYSASSFTPVNHGRPQTQYINPLEMHIEKPIEALLDDNIPKASAKQSKKRAAPVHPGRAHSIGAVWEFRDEGDVGYQGKEDELPPKRRKSVPAKRSKSAKGPSQPLAQISESFEESDPGPHVKYNPQLTTPPDSTKRAKSKPGSKSKKPQLPPFKSLTVTKTASTKEKEAASSTDDFPNSSLAPRSSTINSQLGWTTTQEAVKLTKTTLDKLATFRYRPPPQINAQTPVVSMSQNVRTHSDDTDMNAPRNASGVDVRLTSEYEPPKSSDTTYFGDAFWDTDTNEFFTRELHIAHDAHLQMDNPLEAPEAPSFISIPQNKEEGAHHEAIQSESLALLPTLESAKHNSEGEAHATQQIAPTQSSSGYDDPTSSENLAFDNFMYNSEANQINSNAAREVLQQLDVLPTAMSNPSGDETCDGLRQVLASEVEGTDRAHSTQNHGVSSQISEPRVLSQPVRNRCHVPSKEIQVDQSVDDGSNETFDMAKDFELDEFDEGLDDSDLLDFASGAIMTDQSVQASPTLQENGPQSAWNSSDHAQLGERGVLVVRPDQTNRVIASPQSDPIQHLDLDDEFPMDEADQELMLEAAQRITTVHETFEAPQSILNAFDDLEHGEVYDSSLRFSPPKTPTPGLTPNKLAYGNRTDNNSSPQKPGQASQVTTEEEDWCFLQGQNVQTATSPEVEEDYRCFVVSPPPAVRKVSDFFTPQDIQECVDPTKDILDDSHEYLPLKPFVRPDFPALTPDRCPIVGVSTQSFLRVCFRVGEMFKEGGRRNALGQDAVIELYAKVMFSTREAGSTKQLFQFGDLFHDKSPTANGVLMNYKTTGLADSESKIFLAQGQSKMARCLGRLKRDRKTASGWLLHIITVRETDWEEIRWTKRIVSAGLVKSETPG